MLKTTTCTLIGCLGVLTVTAQAQAPQWRVGLLGTATYDRVSNDLQLRFASPGSNTIQTTHEAARGYGVGLSVERALNEHWSLEVQPRYQRLGTDYTVRAGGLVSYGHAAGPQVQLPIGGRYSFGASRQLAPYVLGHAVVSWANPSPQLDAIQPDYQNGMSGPQTSPRWSLGYAASGEQWQVGLEAGAGVRLADLLALNLLAYYGLNTTRLADVRSDRDVPSATGPAAQLTSIGTLRGHLLSFAVQGVLYLSH